MTKRKQLEPKRQDNAHIYEEYTRHKPIRVKQRLTMASIKKSTQTTNTAANSENFISAPAVIALNSDLKPKHEHFDNMQGSNDPVDFTMNDKREFPSLVSTEGKSYFTTDLVMQNTYSSKYEDLMSNRVDLYPELRSVCNNNNNNNNTRHRQPRTMTADKIPCLETNLGKYAGSDGQHDIDAFKMKAYSWHEESQNSFDGQTPLTANGSPNFVKSLESFVDSVRRLENNRLVTNCHAIFSKEVLPVKSVTNHSLIPQHHQNTCASPGLYYAHCNEDYTTGLPLDLSKKSRQQCSERATNQFKPLLVGGPSEISSLKHLEEKFGANSTILEYIGTQSNVVSGAKPSRVSSENGFSGRCFPQRLLKPTMSSPSDHSPGSGPPPPPALDKVPPSHLPASNQARLLCKTDTRETPGNVTGSPDDFQLANGQYSSQYLHTEAAARQASVPCSFLSCACGSDFGFLSLLMAHLQESGHRLLGTRSDDTKSTIPRRQRLQRKQRRSCEEAPYIPQCADCGGAFLSLPELTLHMIQTAHFTNLVIPSAVVHRHRSSSVCSASTLDSLEGSEDKGGFEARANASRAAAAAAAAAAGLWSAEVPLRAVDFPWKDIGPLTVTQQSEYMSYFANDERFNRLEIGLEQTSASQSQSLRRFAPVKLETGEHDARKLNGNSSDFSSDGRSCYSSPSFNTDLETIETNAESNLKYSLQNGSYKPQNVVHDAARSVSQTSADVGSVSALVAMQDFVQRSFSSCRNSDLGRDSLGHNNNKQPAFQYRPNMTPDVQWQVPQSTCQKTASPNKRKRPRHARDLKSPNPSNICPDTAQQKRKGTAGKSRNLSYWKNVSTGGGKRSDSTKELTSELLRNRRINAWQRFSIGLFDDSTSNRTRPSSVDGGIIPAKERHATPVEPFPTRKRRHSVDFQTVSSTDDADRRSSTKML